MPSHPGAGAEVPGTRIGSIDALRGLVMLLMLVDHVRDLFYLQAQVRDPMDLALTPPDLFLTRALSHLCAPAFILLTGLSAALYRQKHGSRAATARFLLTRGLLLVLIEVTLVNFAWTGSFHAPILYLQVIWAIGLSMVALAGLLWLPRAALAIFALAVMFGHNLLDPIVLAPDQAGYPIWSVLHQRGFVALPWGMARTSYPVLPWIGVIAAGYVLGPLFAAAVPAATRQLCLVALGVAGLTAFGVLRGLSGYGDPHPWQAGETIGTSMPSFLNLTKYPPSAAFLLLTLGIALLLLALFETLPTPRLTWLSVFGGAPLFFYLLHLGLLRLIDDVAAGLGAAPSGHVALAGTDQIWLTAAALSLPLYGACRWMIALKRSGRWPGLSYL